MIALALIVFAIFVVLLAGISKTWRHDWPRPPRTESRHVGEHLDEDRRRSLLLSTLDRR